MKDALDPASLIESLTTQRQEERLRAMNAERRVAELEARWKALCETEPIAIVCHALPSDAKCHPIGWLTSPKQLPEGMKLIPRPEAK